MDIITDDTVRAIKLALGCAAVALLVIGAAIGAVIYRAVTGSGA